MIEPCKVTVRPELVEGLREGDAECSGFTFYGVPMAAITLDTLTISIGELDNIIRENAMVMLPHAVRWN